MTTGLLPQQIPPQSTPFGTTDQSGGIYVSLDWYLFMYNLALQVLGNGSSQGNPTSTFDLSDAVDLDAAGTDVPQAYRQISNIEQLLEIEPSVPGNQSALVNALLLASDPVPQDPLPPPGPVIPITAGTSPLTYTAIHDGTFIISGPPSATINIIRYGITVPTGMTGGTIPMRKKDQISVTWSGGTAPVMNFLPNR